MHTKQSMEKAPEHYENEKARPSLVEQDPFDYDKLNYGQSGLSGLLSSPYVFGAAFLASMGGFSFGYGKLYFASRCALDRMESANLYCRSGRDIADSDDGSIPCQFP